MICYGFSAVNVFVLMLEIGKDKANCLCKYFKLSRTEVIDFVMTF
jgi:hypothetical protein